MFLAGVASLVVIVLAAAGLSYWQDARKRSALLAAMSDEDREAFLEKERRDLAEAAQAAERAAKERRQAAESQRNAWESRKDAKKAVDAIRLVEVAVAEGRTSTRVWVKRRDVDAVRRWGERNRYVVLVAKEWGRHGGVQLSISWTNRSN